MQIYVIDDREELGRKAADVIEEGLAADTKAGRSPILGLATGSSPEPLYAELRKRHAAGKLDFSELEAFALDQYVGIDPDHPESYRNVLLREVVNNDATGLKAENMYTLNESATDLEAECARYDAEILGRGGVSIQILGIGSDGHIAFNEPYGSLRSHTHIGALTRQTREDNSRFFDNDIDKVPTHCMTQGLATIMSAKQILLIATGKKKGPAIAALAAGPVTSACPASVLQFHEKVTLLIDQPAAQKLPRDILMHL
ncbi:MAG: glucosamine-6-phosphate deaminase [Varibaculum sp.]|nr:glucosamine-6-phosphate deaminase [Varibaculum sp.]